jgi:hypothetical protein
MNDAHDNLRDPGLSRLYAQAGENEPPPALDAAILAAARAASAAPPPPRPWWRRLQAPLALAASVIIAVALTLSMDRNPPADFAPPASAPLQKRQSAERTAPASADAGSAPAALAPARQDAPRAAEAKREALASARERLAPSPSAAATAPPESGVAKTAPAADMASESLAGSARQKSAAAPALQASREAPAPPPPKTPEAWLAEIRNLRGQGKLAEVESSLREFRAAYPDYPLPEDFR